MAVNLEGENIHAFGDTELPADIVTFKAISAFIMYLPNITD